METTYEARADRYAEAGRLMRRCGRSGVVLPAVSLGLWKNFGTGQNPETAQALIHFALDHGIVHLDLANNYGPPPGAAEETLGRLLATSLAPYRDELFIATKAGYDMWPGPYGNWGSRKSLMASMDQSLRRLGTDYVDLFYSHRYDPLTPLEETLQALVDLVRAGKALYVGLSRWPLEATRRGLEYLRERDVPCLCYQGRLNLLDRTPVTEGILPLAERKGCGFVAFSPLAQGLLTDRYLAGIPDDSRMKLGESLKAETLTPALTAQLRGLKALADERGETVARVALKWVLQHEGVTSVIVGASRVEQLNDNLQCLDGAPLSPEELARIEALFG